MTALICPLDVKKIEPIMFYEGTNTKVCRHSFPFSIALVVTSRSSSFEYTMSVHAVHAGAERNVCNIVVSSETPQTTTNPSQLLLPVYKLQSNFGRSNSPVSNTRDRSNSFVGPSNFPIYLMLKYTPGSNRNGSNSRTQSTVRRAIFHVKTL